MLYCDHLAALCQCCWTCLKVSVHTLMKVRSVVCHLLLPLIIESKEGTMKDFLREKTAEVSKQVWPD